MGEGNVGRHSEETDGATSDGTEHVTFQVVFDSLDGQNPGISFLVLIPFYRRDVELRRDLLSSLSSFSWDAS